jgi:hypothetical protein
MELEELKNLWKRQSMELEKITTINEKLLKNTFTQKTNGVIDYFLKWEYFSLLEFVIFLLFMFVATYKFMDDWRFLISGIFITLFLISCVIASVTSIKQLNKIDLFSQSIIDIKHRILIYKKRSNQSMKVLLFLIPPVIVTFIPLGTKLIRNICLYDYPVFFLILSLSVIVLSYIIAFISYQAIFSRKFKEIENSLVELEKFKEE